MADNSADVLAQLRAHGLLVEQVIADGKTHRCRVDGEDREKRGWYLLHDWLASDGSHYLVGSFGVWRGNEPGSVKVELNRDQPLSSDEKIALRARLAEDRKRAKAQRQAEAGRAAARAAAVWAKALTEPPAGGVEYLERKGIQAHGLRYTDSGALIVPMQDVRGEIKGLQFILPKGHPRRKKLKRDKTYWPAGLGVAGHFHLLGAPAASPVTLIAEGYATAATLHEATGLPVAVAFAANNLMPVAKALRAHFKRTRLLICADDDYLTDNNPGRSAASTAALAVAGALVLPQFPSDRGGEKLTDFNDLAHFPTGGVHLVREQVMAAIEQQGWDSAPRAGARPVGGGDGDLKPLLTIDEACARYSLVYGGKATLFDHWEHELIPKSDVLDVLPDHGWRTWKERPDRKIVRMKEVGFDPSESDPQIKCNLWGGWPTEPKAGECEAILDLLRHLCSAEPAAGEVYQWVMRWLAYPIQHPGAKMKTSLVFHGGQGVGKNMFFEAIMAIYGEYGRIVDQSAIEDKFNDWASKKLFMVCDEVVARMELYHLKNKLKALVTGDSIRINPKNVTPHDEKNAVNLVFLSNERQPLVLEKDDRRYVVVWVPDKLPQGCYEAIGDELKDGGIAALHHHLLNVELGDFKPWTAPPPTRAKGELIDISLESTERFIDDWLGGDTEWPVMPCASMDLYTAYRRWAAANGVAKPRESNHFIGHVNKRNGWTVRPCHVYESESAASGTRSQKMVLPPDDVLARAGAARAPDERAVDWTSRHFFRFRSALNRDNF